MEAESHKGPEYGLERMIFFSDAVFAIAITLLVIEIHVPELPRTATDRDYLIGLLNLTPNFIGFFISFIVVGAFWAGHHRTFAFAQRWDQRLFMPNLVFLLTIAAMPFFTALASEGSGHRVPVMAYCIWMTITAIAHMWLQHAVLRAPVVQTEVSAEALATIRRRGRAVALGAVTATVVAYVFPYGGQATLATIPLWRLGLNWIAKVRTPAVSPKKAQPA
ncbi:TMEM175 family protein [soil metagenome]